MGAQRLVDNPYAVLGLNADATPSQIRKAFRRLALRHHPDRNPGDPKSGEQFRSIYAAYQILIDPVQRSLYDAHKQFDDRATERPPPGYTRDELHYPSAEEIVSLARPRERSKARRWLIGLLLGVVAVTAVVVALYEASGLYAGPPEPAVQDLRSWTRRY